MKATRAVAVSSPIPGIERRRLTAGICAAELELALSHLDVVAEGLDLPAGRGQRWPQRVGDSRVGIGNQSPDLGQYLFYADRDHQAQLA